MIIQKRKKRGTFEEQYGIKRALEIKEILRKARLNQKCPRLGKKHSEKTKKILSEKRKLLLREHPEASLFKKGKSFISLFGEKRARGIIEKIKKARKLQKSPRIGKKHTEASKRKMSKSRLKFLKENPEVPKNHSNTMKELYRNLSMSERERRSRLSAEQWLSASRFKSHSYCVPIKYWYSEKRVLCESSYEYLYYTQLNLKKVYWEKNSRVYLSYVHPLKKENRHYIPDALIYSDKDFKHLESIVEIKPFEFLANPKNRKSIYYLVTKNKKEALIEYCKKIGVEAIFITEKEIEERTIKNTRFEYENKKNYKEDLLQRKRSILSKCK
jgi:hypothetical protein